MSELDETIFCHLGIVAAKPGTEIWLGNDHGFLVQKDVGTMTTQQRPGVYTVGFGPGAPLYELVLEFDCRCTEAELTAGPRIERCVPQEQDAKEVSVRVFQSSEWRTYRRLRLLALESSPDAFGTTLSQAQARPLESWAAQLASASPDLNLPLLVEVERRPGGLAWGMIDSGERRVAHVYQMWIAPEYRGMGAGRKLLSAITAWAKSEGIRTVCLGVTCDNTAAEKLYLRAGFVPLGDPSPIRPGSDLLSQAMELEI